jgi:hypothetical protein
MMFTLGVTLFLRYKEARNMELIAATKIVEALHLGKSPETDEPLPPGSICLQEDVKPRWRWLWNG